MAPATAHSTTQHAAEAWFGPEFSQLHPALQQLHRHGGRLSGKLAVHVPHGFAGWIGRRLARRAGLFIGSDVDNEAAICITPTASGLRWERRFNRGPVLASHFTACGHYPSGHWEEAIGPIKLLLGVDITACSWRWQQKRVTLFGCPLPTPFVPIIQAGKRIDADGRYRFDVAVQLPLLGPVLRYEGALDLL